MKAIKFISIFLISYSAIAQQDVFDNAITYYQNGDLENAKSQIDQALQDEKLSADPYAWYFKGVIYKDLYKQDKLADSLLLIRIGSTDAFKKSIELDISKEFEEQNLKNLKYLGATFFNEATVKLQQKKFEVSRISFDQFVVTMSIADPLMNMQEKEIEYLLSVASVNNRVYNESQYTLNDFLISAKTTYIKVIEIDQNNLLANYNIGIIYYNEAVRVIQSLGMTLDILALRDSEEKSIELFKKSLPFMEKGYAVAPEDANIIEALYEIYYSLNEEEKAESLKVKLDKIKGEN